MKQTGSSKQLPQAPYSDSELRAFVKRFTLVGEFNAHQAEAVQTNLFEQIRNAPPEVQVMFVSSFGKDMIGKDAKSLTQKLGDDDFLTQNGAYYAGRQRGMNDTIVWHLDARDSKKASSTSDFEPSNATKWHETWHRIDRIMGSVVAGVAVDQNIRWLSKDSSLPWHDALENEKKSRAYSCKPGSIFRPALYSGERSLEAHLKLPHYNKPGSDIQHSHTVESFAEVGNDYTSLYVRLRKQGKSPEHIQQQLDTDLGKKHPDLYPLFKNQVLPLVKQEAASRYHARQQKLDGIVEQHARIAAYTGVPFAEATVRQHQSVLEINPDIDRRPFSCDEYIANLKQTIKLRIWLRDNLDVAFDKEQFIAQAGKYDPSLQLSHYMPDADASWNASASSSIEALKTYTRLNAKLSHLLGHPFDEAAFMRQTYKNYHRYPDQEITRRGGVSLIVQGLGYSRKNDTLHSALRVIDDYLAIKQQIQGEAYDDKIATKEALEIFDIQGYLADSRAQSGLYGAKDYGLFALAKATEALQKSALPTQSIDAASAHRATSAAASQAKGRS